MTTRRTPRQERSRLLVDSVVEATTDLLSRGAAVSVRSIAKRAGVGIGSIYQYFSSRDGIFGAVVDRFTDDNYALFEQLHAEPDVHAMLERGVDQLIRSYLDRPTLTQTALTTLHRMGWAVDLVAKRDEISRMLARRLHSELPGLPYEEVEGIVHLYADLCMGAVLLEAHREPNDARRAAMRTRLISLTTSAFDDLKRRSDSV
ncbi:MAG: TetR/AcrR family transcriptional regulator [Sandaracinaceae bacterium]